MKFSAVRFKPHSTIASVAQLIRAPKIALLIIPF